MRIRLYGGPDAISGEYVVDDGLYDLKVPIVRRQPDQTACPSSDMIRFKIERYGITYGRIAYRELKFGVAEGFQLEKYDEYQIRQDLGKTPIQYTELSILNDFDAWFDQICHKVTGFTYRTRDPLGMV